MNDIELQKYLNTEIGLDKVSFEPEETYCMKIMISGQKLRENLKECMIKTLEEITKQLKANTKS